MLPRRTQLGQRVRALLLEAPPEFMPPVLLLPHVPGGSITTATLKAARTTTSKAKRTLVDLGLLTVSAPVVVRGVDAGGRALLAAERKGFIHDGNRERAMWAYAHLDPGGRSEPRWKRHVELRTIQRTAKGDELVTAYRRELENGLPIRWRKHT